MKSQIKFFLFLFVSLLVTGTFTSCSEDDDLPNGGTPKVSYVRVTRAASSDSLVEKAGQGRMIAIIGENLQDARELWINDQQAALQSTFITSTSIITQVPSNIPTEITNKMRIIFANGQEIFHDFTVDINEPIISYMESEFVNAGEIATIRGSFFYDPIQVFFTGANGARVEGEVVDVSLTNAIQVRVPADAQPGPITVKSNFGEGESDFWFRDNRNVIADFEDTDFNGWWTGKDYIIGRDAQISSVDGKFLRVNKESTGSWFEAWVGEGTIKGKTKNIPADAFANPGKYSLKFEINTVSPLVYNGIQFYMGTGGPGDRSAAFYAWSPNIDTKNKWQTVSIPFEDFYEANNKNGMFTYNPDGYSVSLHFVGPGTKAQFGLDNLRVVPNTIQ